MKNRTKKILLISSVVLSSTFSVAAFTFSNIKKVNQDFKTFSNQHQIQNLNYRVEKLQTFNVFPPGYQESHSYRIPSMIKTVNNKLIALVDQRLTSQLDFPYTKINQFIRTSLDNGKTWSNGKTILKIKNKTGNVTGAIDSTLIDDTRNNGSIYMAIDVFPGGSGLMNIASKMNPLSGNDMGYTPDNKYQKFFILNDSNKYILKNYKKNKNDQWYRVYKLKDSNWSNTKNSNLEETKIYANQFYDHKNGELTFEAYENVANIDNLDKSVGVSLFDGFNNGNKNYKKPKYYISSTAYIYLFKSKDEGETWEFVNNITPSAKGNVKNINAIVLGPGQGLVLKNQTNLSKNGRLLLPFYAVNWASPTNAYPVYSDDQGQNWTKANPYNYWGRYSDKKQWKQASETQMIESEDGTIFAFLRTSEFDKYYVSKSLDGGENWISDDDNTGITMSSYSHQGLNAKIMHGLANTTFEGNEYTFLSLPTTTQRIEGKLFLIKNNQNNRLTKIYDFNQKGSKDNTFGYSTINILEKGENYIDIGVLYEKSAGSLTFAADGAQAAANKSASGLIFEKLRVWIND